MRVLPDRLDELRQASAVVSPRDLSAPEVFLIWSTMLLAPPVAPGGAGGAVPGPPGGDDARARRDTADLRLFGARQFDRAIPLPLDALGAVGDVPRRLRARE
jgi:hypothetical protein